MDYQPWLRNAGFSVEHEPFFDDAYLDLLYRSGQRRLSGVLASYARRLVRLAEARDYDLLWIEKEALPWIPAWAERALLSRPYVLDYDDAWFERYAGHDNPLVRLALARKLEGLVRHASAVIVGNDYLAGWARSAGARQIAIIPTCVDPARYDMPAPQSVPGRFTIGWIGSPSSAPFLVEIAPALEVLTRDPQVTVRVVGADTVDLPGVRLEHRPWSEETEIAEIAGFDVGIMPLPDTAWTRGKCGFKLIQYLAAGRPAVASPVGANRGIVQHGRNGYLAETLDDWIKYLLRLRSDAALRRQLGAAGQVSVRETFSTSRATADLVRTFRAALAAG
jgi:glycosyltransferase involved in cell wall biosynthesis